MYIKKGDNVIVISGKDRGRTGKVLKAFPAVNKILVEGMNMYKKHQRPNRTNQKGQVIEKAMPVDVSTVAVVDPTNGKPTRIGKKLIGERWVRVTKKSGATI